MLTQKIKIITLLAVLCSVCCPAQAATVETIDQNSVATIMNNYSLKQLQPLSNGYIKNNPADSAAAFVVLFYGLLFANFSFENTDQYSFANVIKLFLLKIFICFMKMQ